MGASALFNNIAGTDNIAIGFGALLTTPAAVTSHWAPSPVLISLREIAISLSAIFLVVLLARPIPCASV